MTALATLTGRFGAIARLHDVAALDAYVASDTFFDLLAQVPPGKRAAAFTSYGRARVACLKRKPVAAPKATRADWKKPGEIDRFKKAWFQHKGNKYLVAREMGITEGAVKVAHNRFIKHGATTTYVRVSDRAGEAVRGRDVPVHRMAVQGKTESVPPLSVAA